MFNFLIKSHTKKKLVWNDFIDIVLITFETNNLNKLKLQIVIVHHRKGIHIINIFDDNATAITI